MATEVSSKVLSIARQIGCIKFIPWIGVSYEGNSKKYEPFVFRSSSHLHLSKAIYQVYSHYVSRPYIFSGLLLILLITAVAWNIRQAGKPISADEIPQWELVQETQDSIVLQSVAEPDRKTEAFLAGPSDSFGCDTLIILAGAETGPDFFNSVLKSLKKQTRFY